MTPVTQIKIIVMSMVIKKKEDVCGTPVQDKLIFMVL